MAGSSLAAGLFCLPIGCLLSALNNVTSGEWCGWRGRASTRNRLLVLEQKTQRGEVKWRITSLLKLESRPL